MASRTHVLIAEQFNLGLKLDGTGSTNLRQPPNLVDWSMYDELHWTLSVLGISDGGTVGAPGNTLPTAFSLSAQLQYRQMHAGSTGRFQTGRWSAMSEQEVATHIVEQQPLMGPGAAAYPTVDAITGVGAGVICTQATTGYSGVTGLFTNPIVVRRTLKHFPSGVRCVLSGSFTGGTAPRVLVGLEVTGVSK